MRFAKMHGAGNDFVVIDAIDRDPPSDLASLARLITDRRRGVGADGLIVIDRDPNASDRDAATSVDAYRKRIFNRDGSEAEICGNGIRCLYRWLERQDRLREPRAIIRTGAGTVVADGNTHEPSDVGVELPEPTPLEPFRVDIEGQPVRVHPVDAGNPHAVVFLDRDREPSLDALPIERWGPLIAGLDRFPEGANVEFVRRDAADAMSQRTWERGSGETLACGSGACAVVVAGVAAGVLDATDGATVALRGGQLRIRWAGPGTTIRMEGPAVFVYEGTWPSDGSIDLS